MNQELKLDPITYEVVKHKIWQTLWEGRLAMELVSGSVVVTEAKEVLYSLYDKEGNVVASSAGLLVHIVGGERMIKQIIEWYSDSPGIYEGDVFFMNDPYVGGLHAPDQGCIAPVYYQGEHIGWLLALFHTPEIGAIEPASMCPSAKVIFHEGLRCPGLKLMEKGKERKDTYMLLARSVRDPIGITLDAKARVAALNVGIQRITELIDKYNWETMDLVFKQMIIDAEKRARAKLKELPDGTWRLVSYLDHDGEKYNLIKFCLAIIKKGDHLTFDFTGTDPQLPGPTNSPLFGVYGFVFTVVCTRLFYEEQWNRGVMNVIDVIAPEGCILNCKWPAAVSMSPLVGGVVINMLHTGVSKMMVGSDKGYSDQNSSWNTNVLFLQWGGVSQHGQTMGSLLFDFLAAGQGAGSQFDGVDTGCFQYTPEVIAGDIEMYESIMPFLYLARRQAPDSGGPGKYRGGSGLEIIYKIHKAPDKIELIPFGSGKKASMGPALWGGHQAGACEIVIARDTDCEDRIKQGNIPQSLEQIYQFKGEVKDYPTMVPALPAKSGDVVYFYGGGGGGYGDPLDRDPEAVLKDIINKLSSMEYARDVYGVIIDLPARKVDYEATEERREEIKRERRKRSK